MKGYFESIIDDIRNCENKIECRVRIMTTVRLLLQQVDYALLEWISQQNPSPEIQPAQKYIQPLLSPTDGTLVDAFEAFTICAEQVGWSGASRVLINRVGDRPAHALCDDAGQTTIGVLRSLVAMRNDGAEGHGLVGGYDILSEVDALIFILEALAPFLPIIQEDNKTLIVGPADRKSVLTFMRAYDGLPCLVRKIKVIASNRARAYCQVSLGPIERRDFIFDANNPFSHLRGKGLPCLIQWDNSWAPLCYVPDRTTDSFKGRQKELGDLAEWASDEGSRACLIFGDGGFGKTTLAIEFVHRVLEEDIELDWNPAVIIFHTAKRTQWGLNGLSPIGVGQPHLVELLASVHMLLFARYPDSEFYRNNASGAASKLQTKIKAELNWSPKEILIVIDNAETLIESEEDREQLGRELRDVGRRVGRVLLTSRRRELLEAVPIEIDVLSESDALDFLKDRGNKLGTQLIIRATEDELKKEIGALERRPIVLEAFANAAAEPGTKNIQQATKRVASMLQKELGEFLFADAWARLAIGVRRVLLLMVRIGDAHDGQSLKICADIVGITAQLAEKGLGESGGIATLVTIQGQLQISFSRNFLEFARLKTIALTSGESSPSEIEVKAARYQYSTFVGNVQKFSGDRVAEAFRTPQARAAHRARQDGDNDEAKRLYENAILTDATNGWLRDRFAYFLFHDLRHNDAALYQVQKALELLPNEGEVWFTRGLIESRMGMIRACEISLAKARQLGVLQLRCDVQRAWAYLKSKPVQIGLAERLIAQLEAGIVPSSSDNRITNEIRLLRGRLNWIKNSARS